MRSHDPGVRGPHGSAGGLALTVAERRCRRVAGGWAPADADRRHKITRPWSAVIDALSADPQAPRVAVVEAEAGAGKTVLLLRTIDAIAARGGRGVYASAIDLVRELGASVPLAEAARRCRARRPAIGAEVVAPEGPSWLAIDDVDDLDPRGSARLTAALAEPGPLRCVLAVRPGGLRPRGASVWQLLPFDAAQRRQAIERRLDRTGAAALRAHAMVDPALDELLEVPLFCAAACELVRGGVEPRRLSRRALYRACVDRPQLHHRSLDEYRTARALARSIRTGDPDALASIRAVFDAEAPALGLPWMLVAEGADASTVASAILRERARSASRRPPAPDRAGLALVLEVWLELDDPPAHELVPLLDEVALCLERGQRRRRDGTWVELDDAGLVAIALTLAARAGIAKAAVEVLAAVRVVRGAYRGHDASLAPAPRDRARWASLAAGVERGLADRCAVVRWAALWAATSMVARRGEAGFALADRAVALIGDPAPAVRSLACRTLAAIDEPGAPRMIAVAFAARDADTRAGAAAALGALATVEARAALLAAADAIVAAPIDAADPVPAAVFGALEAWADAIARAAPSSPADAAALARRFTRALERGLPRIGAIAASGLGKIGDLAAALRLAPLLDDRDARVAVSAAFAFERLCDRFARDGAAALGTLLRSRLGERGPTEARRHVAAALHHLASAGPLDDATLHALVTHAADDDDRVAASCIGALAASDAGLVCLAAAAAADPLIATRRSYLAPR